MILSAVALASFLALFAAFLMRARIFAFVLVLISAGQLGPAPMLCTGSALFLLALSEFVSQKKNGLLWWAVLSSLAYFAAVFLARPYVLHLEYFVGYAIALCAFVWTFFSRLSNEQILKIVVSYGMLLVLFGIAQKIVLNPPRIYGPLVVATAYAVVLVTLWTIWFVEGLLSHRYSNAVLAGGSLLVLIAILLSGTRMGLLGFAGGLFLGGLLRMLEKEQGTNLVKKIFGVIGVLIVLLVMCVVAWQFIPDDMFIKQSFNTLLAGKLDSSNMGRIFLWTTGVQEFLSHKIWGIGPGNFPQAYANFLQTVPFVNVAPASKLTHAHNIYLIVLSEQGLLGFLTLGSILFLSVLQPVLYLRKHRYDSMASALLCGCLVCLALGMVDATPIFYTTLVFGAWIFAMMASFYFRRKSDAAG